MAERGRAVQGDETGVIYIAARLCGGYHMCLMNVGCQGCIG
jgi:hypothetical protein